MKWMRRLLGFPDPRPPRKVTDLERTAPYHEAVIAKADRFLRDYRDGDGVLRVIVVRKR